MNEISCAPAFFLFYDSHCFYFFTEYSPDIPHPQEEDPIHSAYTLLKFCLFQSQWLKIILQVFQKFIYPLSGSVIHQEYALTSYIFQPLTNHGNIGMRRMDLGDYADHRTKN